MTTALLKTEHEVRHYHGFCGIGGGARGFNMSRASVGRAEARMRCIGGFDCNPRAIADFDKLSGAKGTVLDLFDRQDYIDFHSKWKRRKNAAGEEVWDCVKRVEPPDDWREVTYDDIRLSAQHEHPHIIFLSPPCKGFSGLLSGDKAGSPRYRALNNLVFRGISLMLGAFEDDLPEFILLENVPLIAKRGAGLLELIRHLLESVGYAVRGYAHNCGEIGGLAQNRNRYLLVARLVRKVPNFIYEPPKRRVKGVGEVLGEMPLPDDPRCGPMHALPRLTWKTLLRLSLIKPGKDWRYLKDIAVEDGYLRDIGICPVGRGDYHSLGVRKWEDPSSTVTGRMQPGSGYGSVADVRVPPETGWHRDVLGVGAWDAPASTVKSRSHATTGKHSIADVRPAEHVGWNHGVMGVKPWDKPAATVTTRSTPSTGSHVVADERVSLDTLPDVGIESYGQHSGKMRVEDWKEPAHTVTASPGTRVGSGAPSIGDQRLPAAVAPGDRKAFNNVFRLVRFDEAAQAVTAGMTPTSGGQNIADPRPLPPWFGKSKYHITPLDKPARTIIGASTTGNGAFAVADDPVRSGINPDTYTSQGQYGVLPFSASAKAVTAHGKHDNGFGSVADPRWRTWELDDRPDPVPIIISLWNTWNRPITTLELAAIQGFPWRLEDGGWLKLEGKAHTKWREGIGNAVPVYAAQAVGSVFAETLLRCWLQKPRELLADTPIWVRQLHTLLAVSD